MAEQTDTSSGSANRVAYDLWRAHVGYLSEGRTMEQSLELFRQCRKLCLGAEVDYRKIT